MIIRTHFSVAACLLMALWTSPAMALSAQGLQTLQAQKHLPTDEHGFVITIETASPLQTLALDWLGVDAYSRLLTVPQYVALENWVAERLAQHF